jgi:uncharacterized protein YggU (UPF0235/DUF167 family)
MPKSNALIVDVQVVARSSRTVAGPAVGERLRVAVTSPPVDGAANAAVIEALPGPSVSGGQRSRSCAASGEAAKP